MGLRALMCVFTKYLRWFFKESLGIHWERAVKAGEETKKSSRTLKTRARNLNMLWWAMGKILKL